MKIVKEQKDGRVFTHITDETYHYSFGYYSTNNWVDDTHLVLVRGLSQEGEEFTRTASLVLVDIENETERELVPADELLQGHICVYGDTVYYLSTDHWLCSLQISQNVKRKLFCRKGMSEPHMDRSGRFVNMICAPQSPSEKWACARVDVVTGESEELFAKRFAEPFSCADHMMICPTDPEKVFFAHEGITEYVSNRLWLWSREKGMHNLAKQKLNEEGDLGDCFGHECWAPDGKGVYFVKYGCSPTPPTGICYVDTEGNQTDVLYGKFNYWHCCCASNGRFLAGDTLEGDVSGVVLIDKETGREIPVYKAKFAHHPCHPHPTFNPDCSKLMFHELYNEQVTVTFTDIAPLLDE